MIAKLIKSGKINASGEGRARRYFSTPAQFDGLKVINPTSSRVGQPKCHRPKASSRDRRKAKCPF
ncbi:hypothetical protein C5F52_17400 [Limnohabitans sp. TS-CS-82]|nr:hypothetical protein C5F52_17400 [Limnohabitans sp. TS-CS-82]